MLCPNQWYYYTTVKSPCRVEDQIYITSNMSSYSGGTGVSLNNGLEQAGSINAYENITAAEHCIYRQDPSFVIAIASSLSLELFQGECQLNDDEPATEPIECDGTKFVTTVTVMSALFNSNGNVSFSNITDWFDSFANAMTNRFRSQYGASTLQ